MQKLTASALLLALTTSIQAGELVLKNGDIIHGELDSVDVKNIHWKSDSFGTVSIPKDKVARFDSSSIIPDVSHAGTKKHQCTLSLDGTVSANCTEGQYTDLAMESLVAIEPPPPYSGSVQFGFNRKDGNTDSSNMDFLAKGQYIDEKYRHQLDLKADSEKTDGKTIDEHYEGNYQLNYDFHPNWFGYGRLGYTNDRFNAIDEQYEIGAGIGHRMAYDNQMKLSYQLGLAYLISHHKIESTDKDLAGRWGLDWSWPIPGSKITLFHNHELLWAMDDINNNQWETSTGLKLPLMGSLFSEFRYDYDYISQPDTGRKHGDSEWVISLGYEW